MLECIYKNTKCENYFSILQLPFVWFNLQFAHEELFKVQIYEISWLNYYIQFDSCLVVGNLEHSDHELKGTYIATLQF